ncbi:MAG: hypothetical protein SCM96_13435 [Acidobacteriota bacterium]|nr:hypothetical protein [Acidobacteriota bacterium]
MSINDQNRGACVFCGREFARGGMTRHLAKCEKRAEVWSKINAKGQEGVLYHLQAQDADDRTYWLNLEVDGSAKLGDIDFYLRAIWLECCGHLSRFSIGGLWGRQIPMSRRIHQVFTEAAEVIHVYDFGTESVTKIKRVGIRHGKPISKHPIVLMARNAAPVSTCQECKKTATHFCEECRIEEDLPGLLCERHAASHPHEDYGEPIRIVNSPRLGMCGYSGPAEPPY